jgi:hypothetical protein
MLLYTEETDGLTDDQIVENAVAGQDVAGTDLRIGLIIIKNTNSNTGKAVVGQ